MLRLRCATQCEDLRLKLNQMEESAWEDNEALSHRLKKVEAAQAAAKKAAEQAAQSSSLADELGDM